MIKLQLFADATKPEVVQGKKIIYLFRLLSEAASESAAAMAFVTENERSKSVDYEATATKDGAVQTPGEVEHEITATAIFSTDGKAEKFEDAMDNNEKIEIWEINLAYPGTGDDEGKYSARYMQGYITELTLTSSAEEHAEYETTFAISGTGEKGFATVSDEQKAIAEYVFKDTTSTGA